MLLQQGTFIWHPLEDLGEPDAQMLALFGLRSDETLTLAEAFSTLIHPDDRDGYAGAVARSIDPAGDGSLRHDLRVLMPDGRERWVEISALTTFDGNPPRACRMAGVAMDISQRKQAEERDAAARINEDEMRREQRQGELERSELASRFQRSLLPKFDVSLSGIHLSSLYLPGERRMLLGGDFLDAHTTSDGGLALLIGDVAGHGPEAASFAVALRASWRAVLLSSLAPAMALAALNEIALAEQSSSEAFATVCVCEIDASRTQLVWASAGHPTPIVDAGGQVRELHGEIAPPLGIGPRVVWPTNREGLDGGNRIFLYTDGLVEGRSGHAETERFGSHRLLSALEQFSHEILSPAVLLRLVHDIAASNGEALYDDVALLAVEVQPT